MQSRLSPAVPAVIDVDGRALREDGGGYLELAISSCRHQQGRAILVHDELSFEHLDTKGVVNGTVGALQVLWLKSKGPFSISLAGDVH